MEHKKFVCRVGRDGVRVSECGVRAWRSVSRFNDRPFYRELLEPVPSHEIGPVPLQKTFLVVTNKNPNP